MHGSPQPAPQLGRRTALGSVLSRVAQPARLARNLRLVTRFARREIRSHPGALHPSMWRRGLLSCRYYEYPGVDDPAEPFISDIKIMTRVGSLNSATARALLRDKNSFADALVARGLGDRAPEVYGTVVAGRFRPRSPESLERLRAQDLVVVKPVAGRAGRGIEFVPGREAERLRRPAGAELLVQERVRQHETVAAVNPTALNTLRVLCVRPSGGEPVIAAAAQRWGTASTGSVDNVSAGGIVSIVDLETGTMGPATEIHRHRTRVEHHVHPDTGRCITGTRVPRWEEVRDLALRLMDAFPEADHVGWDLCVSDRGAVVIEGNGDLPSVDGLQLHGSFLREEPVRRFYAERDVVPATARRREFERAGARR